jgi:subtilase family serine protease
MKITRHPLGTPATASLKLLTALLVGAGALGAHAADEAWVATPTKAHDVAGALHVGALRAGEQVHIAVTLKVRDKAGLDALTDSLMSGKSREHMTSAQFMQRHAPTVEQVKSVTDYLAAHGFSNIEVAANRLVVTADGGPAAVKSAFQADLHEFDVNGRRAYANVNDAMIPAHLAGTILSITGLQDVHMYHTMTRRLPESGADGGVQHFSVTGVSIPNFPSIYGASSMASATSATIGIITQGSMTPTITDLKSFASSAGYPVPPVSVITVGGSSSDTSGEDEWNMDSQSSLAAAGGTIHSMLLYTAPTLSDSALTADYNKVVSDNLAKVINVSLGECETSAKSSGVEASNDQIFQTAVAQGQTFSVSSGDSGSYECGGSTSQQSYPAVSPYVMSLGGTTLSSSGGTWQSETVWSCTTSTNCANSGGTGGGPSTTENAPSWQTAAGVLGTSTKRGVPDIAFDASPNSGALVLVNGQQVQIGGTSLSAPLFTGFYTRIQAANGNSLPFPASTLYQGAAANPSWFHDVTSGSNGGFSAKTGWDYTTGYGSLIVANFAQAFSGGGGGSNPVANFSCTASTLTISCTDSSTDSGGTITSHSWTFGDGGTSTATNPSHTYAAAGTYTVTETVTDNLGKQSSKSSQMTVSGGGSSQELVVNGGFETGSASPWTLTAGVLCTNASCTGETAHSGTGFIWLDGYGTTHTDTATQTIAIPTGFSTYTLTFWLHIDTSETTTTTAYDTLQVQILNSSGTVLATLATYSNLNHASGYSQKSFNMASYAGQTIKLKYTGKEDSSLQTSFVLDDISLKAQ